jgi:hypothetical protein
MIEGEEATMSRLSRPAAHLSLAALLLLLAVHPWLGSVPSAHPAGSAYLFLSPNTEEQLTLDQARARLRSPAHQQFRDVAQGILDQVGSSEGRVFDALGDWTDGTENSLLVVVPRPHERRLNRGFPDEPSGARTMLEDASTLRYVAAWFGLLADQKSVLVFTPTPSGTDAVLEMDVPGVGERSPEASPSLNALRHGLDEQGIRVRTLVLREGGVRVVLYDKGQQQQASLERVARRFGGRLSSTPGVGFPLEESTRRRARSRFQEEIRRFENQALRPRFRPELCPVVVHGKF